MSYDPVGYYETVSAMQRRLHSSEKKRLELEKKLFAYSKSDHRISRLKVAKIQGYLGEVCERERAARHRNQRLLRDFDQIGARVAALSGRADTLRRTKMEYENQVEKLFPSWKEQLGKERQEVLQSAGTKQDGHLYDGNYSTQSFSGLRYPAGALMAHYGLGNRAVNIGLSVPTYQGQTLPGMSVGLGHRLPGTPSIPNVSQKLSVLDDCSFLRGGAVHIEASFGPNDPKRYEMPRECQERSLSQLSNVSGTRQVNMSQGSNGYAIQTAMKAATGPALQDLESHLLETDCDLSEQGASGIQKGSHERCNEGQPIQVEFLTSVKNIDALRNGHFNQPSEMDSSSEAQQHVTDQLDSRPGQTATPSPARASSIEAEALTLRFPVEGAVRLHRDRSSSEMFPVENFKLSFEFEFREKTPNLRGYSVQCKEDAQHKQGDINELLVNIKYVKEQMRDMQAEKSKRMRNIKKQTRRRHKVGRKNTLNVPVCKVSKREDGDVDNGKYDRAEDGHVVLPLNGDIALVCDDIENDLAEEKAHEKDDIGIDNLQSFGNEGNHPENVEVILDDKQDTQVENEDEAQSEKESNCGEHKGSAEDKEEESSVDHPLSADKQTVDERKEQDGNAFASEQSEMTVSNLFHLLHTIEQALEDGEQAGSSELYRSTAVHPADMAWVVSFANGEGGSAEKGQPALSILGAVVLQQLQRLSQETTSGCLLPEELLTADLTAITADILRTYLDVDSGRLWDRWHNHARCLIHHGALSISEIATLFGPLLVCETSDHLPQAVEFLKILLKGEGAIAPDRSLSQAASDDSRSVSKSDRLSQAQLDKTLESQAYQQMRERILKQDTLDENASSLDLKDSGEEKLSLNEGTQAESDDDDDDDIEALLSPGRQESVHSRHLAGAVQLSPGASGSRRSPVESCDGRSNTASLEPLTDNAQHSPPNGAACTTFPLGSRESQSTAASGFNKKAFWGDSDDSISDADAILSPRGQEARADDFDDFYD